MQTDFQHTPGIEEFESPGQDMELAVMDLIQAEARLFPLHAKVLIAELAETAMAWAEQFCRHNVPVEALMNSTIGARGETLPSLREEAHAAQRMPMPLNAHEIIRAWEMRRVGQMSEEQQQAWQAQEKAHIAAHAGNSPTAQESAAYSHEGAKVYNPDEAAFRRFAEYGLKRGWITDDAIKPEYRWAA